MSYPLHRPRRLRRTDALRALVRQTRLTPECLVSPLFVCPGEGVATPIEAMPGCSRMSVDRIVDECRLLDSLGVKNCILFGIPASKDATGTSGLDPEEVVPRAIRAIKSELPDFLVWADICLCEYTDHGHCGVVQEVGPGRHDVDNDATVPLLARAAVVCAEAGADIVAPSDMMDGRVGAIRKALDDKSLSQVVIVSYAAKYASAFYGPFREAADSAPSFGDRRTYQMDPANADEALMEVATDIQEGADIVMVKPALAFLDIVYRVKERFGLPVAAYNVSGEHAMIQAAAQNGWMDGPRASLEALTSIRRAGADIILTYAAKEAARALA